jgi:glycosyltransferase involved in cell wall biosynthesis
MAKLNVSLIGHVYAPIGRGEDLRSACRALREVGLAPDLVDVYEDEPADSRLATEFSAWLRRATRSDVNVYFINGDEIEPVLEHVRSRVASDAYNIVYPAWELPRFPKHWEALLGRFDEVWAPSRFIAASLAEFSARPVTYMPLAVEPRIPQFVGRRYFGIPEWSFVFLFFFDFQSYIARKNPYACIEAFAKLLEAEPYADAKLVIKTHFGSRRASEYQRFKRALEAHHDSVLLVDGTLSDGETKNLIRCCDAFLSLHRSEGFGRGLAEAMYLRKPVIGTGYSGNMDYMHEGNALPVRHSLVPVEPGAYPFGEGQVWADPDVDHAVELMGMLLEDPVRCRALGRAASASIRLNLSYVAIGTRILERLEGIQGAQVRDRWGGLKVAG